MTIPVGEVPVPEKVFQLSAGAPLRCVWHNLLGGLTFTDGDRFYKWGPKNLETSMAREAEHFRWARAYVSCPEVIEVGSDDTHEWLVTRALPGKSAVDPYWTARPEIAVPALGRALREFHDAVPVEACPWTWDVASRIRNAAARGLEVPAELHDAPEIDQFVVCHGDACNPNFLLDDDGEPCGYVDLGSLGIADRWADLAAAAMSTVRNYGPGYEDLLVTSYGLAPDRERLAYYQALWDAT